MPRDDQTNVIHPPSSPPVHFIGPPLSLGPLPAVFYFSLSGNESLHLDPYNQPAITLSKMDIRVFSLTLPAHEGTHPHPNAMQDWAASVASGKNFISEFTSQCTNALDYLIETGYVDITKIAAAGLSRGAFAATHFAAHDARVKFLLGFSPLTQLAALTEFNEVNDSQFSLVSLTDLLADKIVRFYIGNRDTRVNTSDCITFIQSLTEASYNNKHRSPPIELIIYPSIGHKGHGTPPHIFTAGANWLANIMQ